MMLSLQEETEATSDLVPYIVAIEIPDTESPAGPLEWRDIDVLG